MDTPGISLFNPNGLDVLHEADLEDEDDDDEERKRIEEEVAEGLEDAFDDLELDLEEDDGEDSIHGTPTIASEKKNEFATSTPFLINEDKRRSEKEEFHRLLPEETNLEPVTPKNLEVTEERYLRANNRADEIEILYQARGHEINRLNLELQSLRESGQTELRVCKHDLAILKSEKANLMVNVEQLEELLRGANEENRSLKTEIEALKDGCQDSQKTERDLTEKLDNAEHMIHNLQSQLMNMQKSDAMLKARQQHDAIVRSLKERHENEMFNLQQEVDKLYSQVRRQESQMDDLKLKLVQKELSQPDGVSREIHEKIKEKDRQIELLKRKSQEKDSANEEVISEKTKMIDILNARLDENQKRVTDLISDKITAKKLEHEIASYRNALQESEKENEELKINLKALEMELKNYESVINRMDAVEEKDENENFQLKKSIEEVRSRDEEIIQLKDKVSALQTNAKEAERIREELKKVTEKYQNLKKKVKIYQEHCQKKENFYLDERKNLEEDYKATLMALRSKMEKAYITKEQQVEVELMEMQDHFNAELAKIASIDGKLKRSLSSAMITEDNVDSPILMSKKENARPTSSRSEEIDKFFAKAREDAKNKIANLPKMPRPFANHNDGNK